MEVYCRVCGKTQDKRRGMTHVHLGPDNEYHLIQLIPVVDLERKTYGSLSSHNRRIKTTKTTAQDVEDAI
jgi:hypothetical protein